MVIILPFTFASIILPLLVNTSNVINAISFILTSLV